MNLTKKTNQILEVSFYLLFCLTTALFLFWKGQDRNWDLLNYHFYQGYSLLTDRFTHDVAAAGLQSFLNPTANIIAFVSLNYFPFPFSAWAILLIQLVSLPAIVMLAKEIGKALGHEKTFTSAIAAIALSLQAPLWWSELGTTFFSSWTAPLIIWGVYFIFTAKLESSFIKRNLLIAGLFFGLATGLKLTNAPFAVAAVLMVITLFFSIWRTAVRASLYFLIACGVGFLFTAWWNWHLFVTWGSPVFPFYNAIFNSTFYDVINFRDMRWYFASFTELLTYISETALGTLKTSENLFADMRYLIVALLIPTALLYRSTAKLNAQLIAFMWFMASSFILWALVFAYQRYLIPFELLLGLVIWILLARLVRSEWSRNAILIGLNVCALLLIQVPDWGHAPMAFGQKNPFSIQMNQRLHDTAARYLVVRAPSSPVSYVLPYFHPDSRFFGIGFSSQVDNLIFRRVEEPSSLPVRVLAVDRDSHRIPDTLQQIGFDPIKQSLDCEYFRTGIDRYVVCELGQRQQPRPKSNVLVDYDLSAKGHLEFGGVLWDRGLSFLEPWGRWSDGDQVELGLAECLPRGHLRLTIAARAFGPNVDAPIKLTIGENEIITRFSETVEERTMSVYNEASCLDTFRIEIPQPTSQRELGLGTDPRKIGLGLVGIKIVRE